MCEASIEEIKEACQEVCGFVEFRYNNPFSEKVPEQERVAYGVFCFMGNIEGDGILCLMDQPENEKTVMINAMNTIGAIEQVENIKVAEKAILDAGLNLDSEYNELWPIVEPYNKKCFELSDNTYALLEKYIQDNIKAFAAIFETLEKCEVEDLNPYDPDIWKTEDEEDFLAELNKGFV